MKRRLLSAVITGTLVFTAACSKHQTRPVQADPAVQNSFGIVDPHTDISAGNLGVTDKKLISLKKVALDKEFLLQASIMRQIPIPTASGLKSRIVAFKRSGEDLFMMEATQGHVISKDLPSQFILARIPIISETDSDVVLDFSGGMASTFVSGDWYGSDGTAATYTKTFKTLDVKTSFIDDASFHGNALSIRQIAQVIGTGLVDTIEVKYYLEPYSPSATYQKTRGQNLDIFGFFQVAPQYQSDKGNGVLDTYASKWDTTKPIVYAISANTPAEYKEAVRDGILYWNRILPNAALKVVDGPQGVTAPDYDYNVVQWVPWDTAGYAYADAQMDPRTGEIRHAQVFMTSTFAVSGASRAKALLKTYPTKAKALETAYSMAGMIQEPLCQMELQDHFFVALETLAAANAPDTEYLRISQDYIREVVAHEVGHTLGLRHNFAGSLAATYDLKQRPALVADYVSQGKIPADLQPSSSVMEYQVFEEAAMTGQIIRATTRILDYDRKVIDSLYNGTKYAMADVPPFCSDSQTNHLDCRTFDLGKSPVEFIAFSAQQQQQALALNLFTALVKAKKAGTDPALFVNTWAKKLLGTRSQLLGLTGEETPLIQVRRKFLNPDDYVAEKVRSEEQAILEQSLRALGGWETLMTLPGERELKSIPFTLRKMMREYTEVQDGQTITFSLDEQQRFEALMRDFMGRLAEALPRAQWADLATTTSLPANEFTDGFLDWASTQAHGILLETTGQVVKARWNRGGKPEILELPVFKSDRDLRNEVAKTLAKFPVDATWKVSAIKEELRDELKEILDTYMPDNSSIKYKDLDDVGQEWRATEQGLLRSLL